MKKNQHLSWNDYLFENRNKAYGAYVLRTGEGENLLKSLLIGLSIIGVLVAIFSFTNKNNETIVEDEMPIPTVHHFKKIVDEKPPLPEKPATPKVIPAATTPDKTDSQITPNPTEKPDVEQPLTINRDLGKVTMPNIGTVGSEGTIKSGGEVNGTVNTSDGTTDAPSAPAPEKIFTVRDVTKMAVFPGCENAGKTKKDLEQCMAMKLQEELGIQLDDFGETAAANNIGIAKAKLHFVVDKSGKIVDVKALNGGNEKFSKEAQEALKRISDRLSKRGKYLQPAELSDGTVVNMNFTIPVQFQLQ